MDERESRFDDHEHRIEEPDSVSAPEPEADDLPVGPSPSSPDLRKQIEADLEEHLDGDGDAPPLEEDYGGPGPTSPGPAGSSNDGFSESER
ncbi:MAG: hypothetical protein KJ061_08025 [Vicinamibacteraceae bacterium]|nr:hypothetical protein [Vicinamibacteraceae bacterium]